MKKILVITSTFPRAENDPQVPWLGKLVRKLRKKGINIEVFAPAFKGLKSHTYFGVKVHRFRYCPKPLEILTHEEGAVYKLRQKPWLFAISLIYIISGTLNIFKLIKNNKYGVVHVHWPFPNAIFGYIVKKIASSKMILSFHGAEFTLLRKIPFSRKIMKFLIKKSDYIIANSNFTKRKIQNIYNTPVNIIPFAFAINAGKNRRQTAKKNKKSILYVGRLIERKGVFYLIKAMPQVFKRYDARLDIIGEGDLLNQLIKKTKTLNISKKVFFHGRTSDKKLSRLYEQCSIFVLPSIVDRWGDTEGLGVVLLEAMNYGKPVIASNVGGIPDIVTNKSNGLLVRQKNSQALADAIIYFLTKPDRAKRMGLKGKKVVLEKFHWDSIIDKTISLYND